MGDFSIDMPIKHLLSKVFSKMAIQHAGVCLVSLSMMHHYVYRRAFCSVASRRHVSDQITMLVSALRMFRVPVLACPGIHDIFEFSWQSKLEPTKVLL